MGLGILGQEEERIFSASRLKEIAVGLSGLGSWRFENGALLMRK